MIGLVVLLIVVTCGWFFGFGKTLLGIAVIFGVAFVTLIFQGITHRRLCKIEGRKVGTIWYHMHLVQQEDKVRRGELSCTDENLENSNANTQASHSSPIDSEYKKWSNRTKQIAPTFEYNDVGNDRLLKFVYRDANGQQSNRIVRDWVEGDEYFNGHCLNRNEVRTFRKDRVVSYLECTENYLDSPYKEKIVQSEVKRSPKNAQSEIAFTGFLGGKRIQLESLAHQSGLKVCKSVTNNLRYLCVGANASQQKVDKAALQGAYIIDEFEFLNLIRTGEIPE